MFTLKPDYDAVLNRFEAWWHADIVDRALFGLRLQQAPEKRQAVPVKTFASHRERWLDTGYLVERTAAAMGNQLYLADSLPIVIPNLGPEVFSACYGCELEYGENTTWSHPILKDLTDESLAGIAFDMNSFAFRKLDEMSRALLAVGKGNFIVGYTDVHPGGDAIAAFRDPQELLLDTIDNPAGIKKLVARVTDDFIRFYDYFYDLLSGAGMPSASWLPAIGKGRFHIPSNDFSCMISDQMFEELFIPGIIRECQHMDHCIYHLDGPQALRYLDRLLEIPEIQAIQWVPGAGHGGWRGSVPVYQRIQSRGKAFYVEPVPAQDLDELFTQLAPEGVWISAVTGVATIAEADAVTAKIAGWTRRKG